MTYHNTYSLIRWPFGPLVYCTYYGLRWLLVVNRFRPPLLIGVLNRSDLMSTRSHGISHTSFLVYSPDLPIQVTIALSDFTVFCQLVFLYPPYIRFLFVEPRFRYVFLSPPLTEVSFDSRYRVHRQQVPQGNCTPDVQHARRTKWADNMSAFLLRRWSS